MKRCDYCGRANNDTATACRECGSPLSPARADSVPLPELRKLEPDEIPLPAIAQKDGNTMTLRCRTPKEAYLIRDELGEADILAILPDEEQLQSQFERDGFVEVRVSAKAYESLADLRSGVEFQYKRLRAEQPLSNTGKLMAMACGAMIVPGVLLFAYLHSNYQENGYNGMARGLRLWFLLGIAAFLLLTAAFAAIGSA